MRVILLLVLVFTACTTAPNAATSPTPSPTASPTATATQSPTSSPTPSPSPIVLPSIAQLSAPSGTVVWALVAGTHLFRSTTRGDSWEERALPHAPNPQSFAFVSEREGFLLIAGDPGTLCGSVNAEIWRTSDGAATWQKLQAAGINDPCKSDISAASPSQAFVVGLDQNKSAVVYRTQDGGLTWQVSKALPNPPVPYTLDVYPRRVQAFGPTSLMAVTVIRTLDRYIYRSTHRGANWNRIKPPPPRDVCIAFVTDPHL